MSDAIVKGLLVPSRTVASLKEKVKWNPDIGPIGLKMQTSPGLPPAKKMTDV